jgi:histidinol-phosphate phosphatase family protein
MDSELTAYLKPERRRAVFLDRDGVINAMVLHPEFGVVDSPANPEEMVLLPQAAEAIAALNRAGLVVIVVSNQPGIAKGKFTQKLLEAIELKIETEIENAGGKIDKIYNCLHHPDALVEELRVHCQCRKPEPGLLHQAAREWQIDLESSYMVGDGIHDIVAGQAAGTKTILVSAQKCYVCESLNTHEVRPDFIVSSLYEGAGVIVALEDGDRESAEHFAYRCEFAFAKS